MAYPLAPRLAGFDYRGFHRYFLTICCHERRPTLITEDAVDAVLPSLRRTAGASGFDVIAYCLMPDHLHVLVEALTTTADCGEFMRLFKQLSAFLWKKRTGRQLWQRSYFDRVLRRDEDLWSVVRYVINNPVRAGIAVTPEEYPFWGSFVMTREELLRSLT